MSSKNFVLTLSLFNATLAAIAEGTTVEKHAKQAVSFGVCTDAKAFVKAFETMSTGRAESLSLTGAQQAAGKVKPSKSKPLLSAAKLVAKHNEQYPASPVVLAVNAEGTYSVVSGLKPKKKRASKASDTVGTGSRKSSFVIAEECCEADGYTIERSDSTPYVYTLNGERCDGHLSKVLYRDLPDDSETVKLLTKYRYKR